LNELQDWQSGSSIPTIARPFVIFASANQFSMSSIGVESGLFARFISEWVLPKQEVARIVVEAIRKVPKVQSICAEFRKYEVAIWTLLSDYDREARKAVYEQELEISQQFRLRDFDFRVSSVDLISPDELKRTGSIEIFRRE
jgi:hypothetical protein